MARRKRRLVRIPLVVAAICVAAMLSLLMGPTGLASAVEFSPDRFCHRSFRYYVRGGLQVWPATTTEWYSPVDRYVHDSGFVSAAFGEPRWHLSKGFAPGVRGWHGQARRMYREIGCWAGSDRWVIWSKEHPELAKILWPQVTTWAQNERYTEIADLFEYTGLDQTASPEELLECFERASRSAQY